MNMFEPSEACYRRLQELPGRYPRINISEAFQAVVELYILRYKRSEIVTALDYPPQLITDIYDILMRALEESRGEGGGETGVFSPVPPKPPVRSATEAKLPPTGTDS